MKLSCLAMLLIGSLSALPASSAIVEISAPISVKMNTLESDTTIQLFAEQQHFALTSNLLVDQLIATSSSGSINAGNTINSFMLHFDPVGLGTKTDAIAVSASGSTTFNNPILGLIWGGGVGADKPPSSLYLDFSDYLGALGTAYPTNELGRGLETEDFYIVDGTQDFFNISADQRTLTVDFAAYPSFADQLRVITAVPVPAAVWLFGSGLLGLFGVARYKKTSA